MPGRINQTEQMVTDALQKEGWTVINTNNGFPDLFCIKGPKIRLVEVKSEFDDLKANQRRIHLLLKKSGINTEIRRIFDSTKRTKHIWTLYDFIRTHPDKPKTQLLTEFMKATECRKSAAYQYLSALKQRKLVVERGPHGSERKLVVGHPVLEMF